MAARRPYRDPGRKPTITAGGRVVEEDDGKIVTAAGTGRMIGNVSVEERAPEEDVEPMPTPTKPLSTSEPFSS
jgi:hypothetical protein